MIFRRMTRAAHPVFERISQHPFNRELYAGTLSRSVFLEYVRQDALYLSQYAKALAMVADRMVNRVHAKKMMAFVEDTIRFEQYLHEHYLRKYKNIGFFNQSQYQALILQSTSNYTTHLIKHANESEVSVAVASLTPCFWVYRELGELMKVAKDNMSHPYRNWIASYSAAEYSQSVDAMIEIVSELGELADDAEQRKMIEVFVTSTQCEYDFWHGVYERPYKEPSELAFTNISLTA